MGWIYDTDYDEKMERLEEIKKRRPPCLYTEDGKHTWNQWDSRGVRECHDCGYVEDTVIPR